MSANDFESRQGILGVKQALDSMCTVLPLATVLRSRYQMAPECRRHAVLLPVV